MSKKIEWIKRGMTANNGLHMQEVCDQIENETSPENLTSVIKGSDTVVVDVAEDKKTVEVHLDNNITTEIHNSLQKPTISPANTQLVAVGTNKAQTMLNIGDGLSVENGSLKASGGKLYYKKLKIRFLNTSISAFNTIQEIDIYFYESNNFLYTIDNIISLYNKIDYATCKSELRPATENGKFIFGSIPSTSNFKFFGLSGSGFGETPITEDTLLFSQIDGTNATLECEINEV